MFVYDFLSVHFSAWESALLLTLARARQDPSRYYKLPTQLCQRISSVTWISLTMTVLVRHFC